MSEVSNPRTQAKSFTESRLFWAVMLMVIFGLLAWGKLNNVRDFYFDVPAHNAESADIRLEIGETNVEIHGGTVPERLMLAEISSGGIVELSNRVTSDEIAEVDMQFWEPSFLVRTLFGTDVARIGWEIALNPELPTALTLVGGAERADVNLHGVQLTALTVEEGVGAMELSLPTTAAPYTVTVNSDFDALQIDIPDDADIELDLSGSSARTDITVGQDANAVIRYSVELGDLVVDAPLNAPLRVEISAGDGDVSLPESLVEGKTGIYETAGYADAETRIEILYAGDVGDFTVVR